MHRFCAWRIRCGASRLAVMFKSDPVIVNRRWHLRLTSAQRLSRLLAATLFPPRCCLCGFPGGSPDLDLCEVCHADLPWHPPGAEGEICALRFEPPVDDLIRRLKYQGELANARVLGVLLAQTAQQRGGALPDWLIPVPLHAARLRERGFNQALALARYAGRLLGIPYHAAAVRRLRDTPSQTSLAAAERRRNVQGAFAVHGARRSRELSAAAHVAIVDDVITTGSTVQELRAVLLAAGVRRVDLWAVASAAAR
jgi:ComF family protein